MATGDDAPPIDDGEADRLLASLSGYRGLVLAVSGGPDSMALMHAAAGWNARLPEPRAIVAVTVDHGLRPELALEAVAVAAAAAELGIVHRTLRWPGDAPASGLQAAARAARYRLLGDAARDLATVVAGPVAIVTAHTADDQAETLLMRLARGSGVDGLAAIPPTGAIPVPAGEAGGAAQPLVRPLLGISRARILATLRQHGIASADDPSNRDDRYERVRVREALAVLEGLGVTREALARTARRMQAAKAALEMAADALEARAVTGRLGLVYEIERGALVEAPSETGVRLLRRLLGRTGVLSRPAELSSVEDAVARLVARGALPAAFTLGGCIVDSVPREGPSGAVVRVYREPERGDGIAPLRLVPGERRLWDGRFWVEITADYPQAVDVGPLGEDWSVLLATHPELSGLGLPAAAARGVPAFREADGRLAVPLLADALRQMGHLTAAMTLAGDGLARKAPWATSGPAFRTTPAWPAGQHRSVSP